MPGMQTTHCANKAAIAVGCYSKLIDRRTAKGGRVTMQSMMKDMANDIGSS